MTDSPLLIANHGAVRRITVNRPDKLNAFTGKMLSELLDAMDRAAARGDDAAVAFDHGGDLLALVRVDQKHDLVVTH